MDALTFVKQPIMRVPIVVALSVVAALAQASSAKTQRPSAGTGVIAGTLRDVASGHPLVRGSVCVSFARDEAQNDVRCERADSAGAFRLEDVPAGPRMLRVACTTYPLFAQFLDSVRVVVPERGTVSRHLSVGTAGCDLRPLRRITRVFSGHYTSGFEMSEFVPCPRDRWFIPSDSVGTLRGLRGRAWVRGTKPGGLGAALLQATPERVSGGGRYFVRWRGTIEGPYNYGHMGMSPFQITVDSVLDARTPGPGDCG